MVGIGSQNPRPVAKNATRAGHPRVFIVWGGHSCPPPLTLGLLWACSEAKDKFEVKVKVKGTSKIKGSGQECPLHTNQPN